MRRSSYVLILASLLIAGIGLTWAKDKEKDGQALYKEYCKPCHQAKSPNGEYTPMTLIEEQWERFFKDKLVSSHEKVTDPNHEGKKVLDLLTPEMLETLKKWVIDHAADSEHPMTCG